MHSMINYWPEKLGCHEIAPYVSSTACMNQPHLHKLHDYCTVFHPSFVQVWHQLHKLHNKNNIVLCSTPLLHKLYKKWTLFHPSFAQVQHHLHKLHDKILYCVPPLICTSCITNEYCMAEFHPSSAQMNIVPWVPAPVCMSMHKRCSSSTWLCNILWYLLDPSLLS